MPKKTYLEIKDALPDINSEKVKDISDELDKILAIKSLFQSDGGKILIDMLRTNCSIAIRKAIIAAKNGDEKLLISLVMDYSANLDLLSSVQDISLEEELRQQLDDAVKEAYRS